MLEPRDLDLKAEVSDVLYITGLLSKGHWTEQQQGDSNNENHIKTFLSLAQIAYIEFGRGGTTISTGSCGGSEAGKLWVRYESKNMAQKAQALLHQQSYRGCTIMCRYELGFDPTTGQRRISRNSIHTTAIRRIQQRRGTAAAKKKNINDDDDDDSSTTRTKHSSSSLSCAPVTAAIYSHKSLALNETEYPFPSGVYLSRLISLVQRSPYRRDDPLVALVSNNYVPPPPPKKHHDNSTSLSQQQQRRQATTTLTTFGNKYAKEMTESMAMVDAVERATKLCLGRSTASLVPKNYYSDTITDPCTTTARLPPPPRVRVYCLGDGKYPITAATMALSFPYPGWEFISIDPILEPIDLTTSTTTTADGDTITPGEHFHHHRLIQFSDKSQNYIIPPIPPLTTSKRQKNNNDNNDTQEDGDDDDDDVVHYVEFVIACHSHAPLQEFWDRILSEKRREHCASTADGNSGSCCYCCRAIAITLPCCANYSDLNQDPVLVFDDYEVYSPKREVRIYSDVDEKRRSA